MDSLKAEIASKRKALQNEPLLAHRPTKYMRRGDIERLRQEYEQSAQEEKRKLEEAERKQTPDPSDKAKVTRVSLSYFYLPVSKVNAWIENSYHLCLHLQNHRMPLRPTLPFP